MLNGSISNDKLDVGSKGCFQNLFKPNVTVPQQTDLIELRYNTPYMQRMKNGVPSVIIQPDANLLQFGFTLAPMRRFTDSVGGANFNQYYQWDQNLLGNTTLNNPMDGFIIVPTANPFQAGILTTLELYGYIRYQVLAPLLVDPLNTNIPNPPAPGDPGFPFS